MKALEFIDAIDVGNGAYIKRFWNKFSGKKEIVETYCSLSTYLEYRDKMAKMRNPINNH